MANLVIGVNAEMDDYNLNEEGNPVDLKAGLPSVIIKDAQGNVIKNLSTGISAGLPLGTYTIEVA